MKLQKKLGVALIAYALCTNFASAASETEGNNDFSTRNIFAPGTIVVDGELTRPTDLSSLTPDFTYQGTLSPNQILSYVKSGESSDTPFFAAIDNSDSGVDTVLGVFDENNKLIALDDDNSPFGNGLASAWGGQVNNGGTINLQITGYPSSDNIDDSFAGSHNESGYFDLKVYLGFSSIADVDFFSFTGLTPGALMKAEITSADFDTTLGLFDDAGNLIISDDDGGQGVLSKLVTTVSSNGVLNFAVSGYPDESFLFGSLSEFGQYQLTLTTVPVPAAVWLFGSGLLGLMGLGNRNRRNA